MDLCNCFDSKRSNIFKQEIGVGFENSFEDLKSDFFLVLLVGRILEHDRGDEK